MKRDLRVLSDLRQARRNLTAVKSRVARLADPELMSHVVVAIRSLGRAENNLAALRKEGKA